MKTAPTTPLSRIAAMIFVAALSLAASVAPAQTVCARLEGDGLAMTPLSLEPILDVVVETSGDRRFNEFSGLTLIPIESRPGDHVFWTVDDEKGFLIPLSSEGAVLSPVALAIKEDLEGVAYDPATRRLAVISEHAGRVLFFRVTEAGALAPEAELTIDGLDGYDTIADPRDPTGTSLEDYYRDYAKHEDNSGWEGLSFTGDGRMFFLKEKDPAILIEVRLNDDDLASSAITAMTVLSCGSKKKIQACRRNFKDAPRPFADDLEIDGERKSVDFSGLAYDADSGLLWIVSDRGRALVLLDPKTAAYRVLGLRSKAGCLEQPEGVALRQGAVYVINDRKPKEGPSRLLGFRIVQ